MSEYTVAKASQIDGDFEGFDDEVLFKLVDGTYWIQDQFKYWYHYAFMPKVNILKKGTRFFLHIQGYNQIVPVRQLYDVIEAQIDGEFNGWEGETEYKLTNGQVWKQSTYNYEYTYAYMPDVVIYTANGGHRMQVEGTTADVRRIE